MEAVGYREAPGEQTRVEELKNRQPGLKFVSLLDYQLPKTMWEMDGAEEEKNDLICIGVDLAYVLHARYVADLFFDQGNYGFYGLEVVLDRLLEASGQEANLYEMIEKHGLVV